MKRRDFFKLATAAGVAGTLNWKDVKAAVKIKPDADIPTRPYKDDIHLSVIGFGGIVVMGREQDAGNRAVAASVDRGVNYFDVAPSYGKGEAEEKLGIALKPYRKNVFLACKTQERTAEGARKELEQSLKRLHTDHFDLYQLHAMRKMEDVEKVFAPGGAMETFLKAREAGKVRYLGFSAHAEDAALALLNKFAFDSVLYPINYVCMAQGNFGPAVIQKAKEIGAARLALKAMAYTPWNKKRSEREYPKCWYQPIDRIVLAERALRFTLSEDVTAAIPPGDERFYELALDLAANYQPLSDEERTELLASTTDLKPLFSA